MNHNRHLALAAALLAGASALATVTAIAAPAFAQAVRADFDIAAQPAPAAIAQLGKQGGVHVVYDYDRLKTVRTKPVRGAMSAGDALRAMLDGAGLDVVEAEGGNLVIRPRPAARGAVSPSAAVEADEAVVELGEVIVTAQKREQRAFDVPQSLTVITGRDIERRRLVGAQDYLRGIPGVNQVEERQGQSIVIRGIETSPNGQNFSSGTTVATYFGESPTTNSGGTGGGTNIDIKLVDIDRVEVLRGPQGTAFGNSSLGGAVRTIPTAPNLTDLEAKVAAEYSLTQGSGGDNHMAQAVVNIPLVQDMVALRAVAYQFSDSGYYTNVIASDPALVALYTSMGAGAFVRNQEEVGKTQFTGGRVALRFQPSPSLKFDLSYLAQRGQTDGQPLASTGRFEQKILQVAPEHVFRTPEGSIDTRLDLANATLDYDLGWGKLVATYSYLSSRYAAGLPFSAIPAFTFPISTGDDSRHREHSGEIRLSGDISPTLSGLVGVYAEKHDDDFVENFIHYGDPASSLVPGVTFLGELKDRRKLEQKAAFAELSWKPIEGLTITGGVRAYDYERNNLEDRSGPFVGSGVTERSAKASGATYRANISYKPGEDALVYATWSQGFRLGKPQAGLPAGVCDLNNDGVVDGTGLSLASTRSIDSDKVDNYEIGAKAAFLDRRLQVAADVFRIDWSGVPVRTAVNCGGFDYAYNANAGMARSEGVEAQVSFQASRAVRIDVGASYTNARLVRDAPNFQPPAFAGDRLPGSPRFNASLGLEYGFDLFDRTTSVRADLIYVGSFYGNLQQSADLRAGDYVKVDVSARMLVDRFKVDLFVKNLTNDDSFTFKGTASAGEFFGFRLRPRTIGVQVGYDF